MHQCSDAECGEWIYDDEKHVCGQPYDSSSRPSATQIGGSHYTDMTIQPVEYILANNIPFVEGCVIKYVSRWRAKGGVEDLKKAKHFLDLLIEHEERPEQEMDRGWLVPKPSPSEPVGDLPSTQIWLGK